MKRKIFSVISIITILILIFTYLNQNPNSPNNRYNINFDSYPEWTVMIYMSGDNWLSEMVSRNLGHMKSVGSTDEVNIITLMDQKGRNNSNLYHIKFQDVNETSLNELNSKYSDELNMGEEKTLIDFVTWTIDNFPAKHYLLDIWGHGKGWEGVAQDGEDNLNLNELDYALNTIVEKNNGNKIDIIGFDACNMAMLEVLYQIKDYADYAVASEKDIPERGWPYYNFLMSLTQNPQTTPEELSQLIVDHYFNAYSSGEVDSDGFSVSLSSIDLTKIDGIINKLEFFQTERGQLTYYENSDFVDLYQYAEINKLDELKEAINNSVIAEKHWSNPDGKKIEHACGITIYYPDHYDKKYDDIKFSIDTQWNENFK